MLIAIDPGVRGALAFFGPGDRLTVHDMPVRLKRNVSKVKNAADPVALQQLVRAHVPPDETGLVVMENLNTFAGGSVQSMGSLEATKAVICTVMELNRLDVAFVTPQAWQKFFGIRKTPSSDTKQQSLALARKLFGVEYCPLAKHDGRADALLIGRYGQRHFA
jgi:hypothetical protein